MGRALCRQSLQKTLDMLVQRSSFTVLSLHPSPIRGQLKCTTKFPLALRAKRVGEGPGVGVAGISNYEFRVQRCEKFNCQQDRLAPCAEHLEDAYSMQPERNYEKPPQVAPPPVNLAKTHYIYPPQPAAPKPRTSILWVVLAIIAVPMFLDKIAGALTASRGTQLQNNGRKLSPTEARAAVQDIATITHSEKAGDPSSLNTSFQPQTELGKQFETLMQTAQAATSTYLKATAEARSKNFLTSQQLGTTSGRADARRIHTEYIEATKTYRIASANYASQLVAFVNQISDQNPVQFSTYKAEEDELARLGDDQSKSISNLLDFVDHERPSYDQQTHKLSFTSDKAIAEYKALAHDIAQKTGDLAGRKEEILQHRQNSLRQSLTTLQGYAM